MLAIWTTELPGSLSALPIALTTQSVVQPSSARVYDLSHLNASLAIYPGVGADKSGAVIADNSGTVAGFAVPVGKDMIIIRSEDLKLAVNNFLDDQKVAWPALRLSYAVLTENMAANLNLPKRFGALVKSASTIFEPGDFIYSVDGRELRLDEGLQHVILSKKTGDKIKVKFMRANQDRETEVTL